MTSIEIYNSISDLLSLIEKGKGSAEQNEKLLILTLDRLALAYHDASSEFDEESYPDPPEFNIGETLHLVASRFPSYGLYNLPEKVASKIGETSIIVGDAIDDIADIVRDVMKVKWRWDNTSIIDALWHFRLGYESHWGNHLRNLQFYLYARKYKM